MVLRIILLVCGTFLLTYTTSPLQLDRRAGAAFESAQKAMRFPVHELALMMMSIALRFIPTLIEETDKIISAQKARGADFESGKSVSTAQRPLLPILVPLFISAFRRADELATAMECRCYNGGEGRTRMKVLRMGRNDYLALAFWAVILAGVDHPDEVRHLRNIALRLRYDGSAYHGWQRQANLPTVQQTVEDAIAKILGTSVHVTGCGRTDAGVHALRYCANFRSDCTIPIEKVPLALNARLPGDIAVTDACEVDESFNAIGSCIQKEYIYKILNSRIPDPFLDKRVCFYPSRLDIAQMRAAAKAFEGTHDFAAVRSVGTETKTTVRTVYWCDAEREGDLITVRVCANGFLYNMVRAMVGTMVYASYGKLRAEDIPALLETRDRRLTGPTMPPQGLYMHRIWYDGPAGEMMADT